MPAMRSGHIKGAIACMNSAIDSLPISHCWFKNNASPGLRGETLSPKCNRAIGSCRERSRMGARIHCAGSVERLLTFSTNRAAQYFRGGRSYRHVLIACGYRDVVAVCFWLGFAAATGWKRASTALGLLNGELPRPYGLARPFSLQTGCSLFVFDDTICALQVLFVAKDKRPHLSAVAVAS